MTKKFLEEIINFYNKKHNLIKKYGINDYKKYKYKFSFDKNKNTHIVEIYDEKLKLKLKAEYDTIGIYNIIRKVWYWAWNIDMIDFKLSEKSKVIKNLKKDISDNYKNLNSKEVDILYYYADNNNFMTNYETTKILSKIGLYYMNGEFIFNIRRGLDEIDKNNIVSYEIEEFICIKNIINIG
jgi:hypothetical protein